MEKFSDKSDKTMQHYENARILVKKQLHLIYFVVELKIYSFIISFA